MRKSYKRLLLERCKLSCMEVTETFPGIMNYIDIVQGHAVGHSSLMNDVLLRGSEKVAVNCSF